MAKYDKHLWASMGKMIGQTLGKEDKRKAEGIIYEANHRYDTEFKSVFQRATTAQETLDQITEYFDDFWHEIINSIVITFREFADDIGQIINDKEYQLNSGSVMLSIQVKKMKLENLNSIGKQLKFSFSNCGSTRSGFDAFARGAGAAFDAYGEISEYLERAKQYADDLDSAIADLEQAEMLINSYVKNIKELINILDNIANLIKKSFDKLEPLIPDFRFDDEYSMEIFNQCAQLVKAIGKLSQMPLLGDTGDISSECLKVIHTIESKINTR